MSNVPCNDERWEFDRGHLPCPEPFAEAVLAGVFQCDDNGFIAPSVEDVRAITEEHARELASILMELIHLLHCAAIGMDPVSGGVPVNPTRQLGLAERLTRDADKLQEHYEDALAAYADGFGWEAAEALDRFVRENCHAATHEPPPVQRELF